MTVFNKSLKPWLIASIIIWALSVTTCKHRIESSLEEDIKQSLSQEKLNNLDVNASGRDITLTIDYDNKAQKNKILKTVSAVNGVRTASINIRPIRPLLERAQQVLNANNITWADISSKNDKTLILNGLAENKDDVTFLINQLSNLEGIDHIENNIMLDIPLQTQVQDAIKNLNITWANISVNDNTATITGKTIDSNLKSIMLSSIDAINGIDNVIDEVEVLERLTSQNCQAKLNDLLKSETILFELNSATVDKESLPLLSKLATVSRQCPETTIEIAGHTDNTGNEKINTRISKQRAQAVMQAIIAQGIPKERLSSKGYGDSQPIVNNNTEENRALNRRIEFKVHP